MFLDLKNKKNNAKRNEENLLVQIDLNSLTR